VIVLQDIANLFVYEYAFRRLAEGGVATLPPKSERSRTRSSLSVKRDSAKGESLKSAHSERAAASAYAPRRFFLASYQRSPYNCRQLTLSISG